MTKEQKYEVVKFMYDNNLSIRKTTKEYPISQTRLYEFIMDKLPRIDRELYDEIRAQLTKRRTKKY